MPLPREMRKRVWVCTWFTCDGKARDGVKAGKDRDLSALDAPAEPAGTAEGPSFTARALSWVLLVVFLLLVHVLQGWFPPRLPSRALLETATELAATAAVLTLCRRRIQEWRMRLEADEPGMSDSAGPLSPGEGTQEAGGGWGSGHVGGSSSASASGKGAGEDDEDVDVAALAAAAGWGDVWGDDDHCSVRCQLP